MLGPFSSVIPGPCWKHPSARNTTDSFERFAGASSPFAEPPAPSPCRWRPASSVRPRSQSSAFLRPSPWWWRDSAFLAKRCRTPIQWNSKETFARPMQSFPWRRHEYLIKNLIRVKIQHSEVETARILNWKWFMSVSINVNVLKLQLGKNIQYRELSDKLLRPLGILFELCSKSRELRSTAGPSRWSKRRSSLTKPSTGALIPSARTWKRRFVNSKLKILFPHKQKLYS